MSTNTLLDIVIPVYNEEENIVDLFNAFESDIKTPFRVFICYDLETDTTLPVIRKLKKNFEIVFVKNKGKGVHNAITTGLAATTAPAILTFGSDEANNVGIIDDMYQKICEGNDIVVASRLVKGGEMSGGPRFKSFVVSTASFLLHHFIGVPASDATYAWRMFSRHVIDSISIESTEGFTYAIELLVKCHRLGWAITEVPARWIARQKGESRFRFRKWLPHYARWFFYALETTYLRKGPGTITLKKLI